MEKPELYQENIKVINLLEALYYLDHLEAVEHGITPPPKGHAYKLPDGRKCIKERLWANWCDLQSGFGNDRYIKIDADDETIEEISKYYKEKQMEMLINPEASSWEKGYYSQEKVDIRIQHARDVAKLFKVFADQVNINNNGEDFIVGYMSW